MFFSYAKLTTGNVEVKPTFRIYFLYMHLKQIVCKQQYFTNVVVHSKVDILSKIKFNLLTITKKIFNHFRSGVTTDSLTYIGLQYS